VNIRINPIITITPLEGGNTVSGCFNEIPVSMVVSHNKIKLIIMTSIKLYIFAIMDIRHKSGGKVDLDDIFSYGVQHVLLTLTHPVPQLSEVNLVGRSFLLLEVFVENDLEILKIVEDVVEGVADDQHRERIVQLVALFAGLVLERLTQDTKDVDCRFAVRLLESTVKGLVLNLDAECR